MNSNTKKLLMNWLRPLLDLQQTCEYEGCTKKAEFCITKYHGNRIILCYDHAKLMFEEVKEVVTWKN